MRGPFRRARSILAHWEDGRLRLQNYATGATYSAAPLAVEVLDRLGRWTSLEELTAALPDRDASAVAAEVRELARHTIIDAMDRPPRGPQPALDRWGRWNPAAGFFHFATRDVPYASERELATKPAFELTLWPYPEALKSYPDARRVSLPEYPREAELARALLERRSWRRFGDGPVSVEDLSTLLGLTWGVQKWWHLGSDRQVALKTAPSGGARHSLEAYVLATSIDGLAAGTYHYCPDTHSLACLSEGEPATVLETCFTHQEEFASAPAVIFMTSVFERVQWRYRFPRAYRVILLEAGHFCQTFCLVATWLDLAPFCTAAFADSAIEEHLGIDGVAEAAIYAAGVGTRPPGVTWAPWPVETENETSLPTYLRQARSAGQSTDD